MIRASVQTRSAVADSNTTVANTTATQAAGTGFVNAGGAQPGPRRFKHAAQKAEPLPVNRRWTNRPRHRESQHAKGSTQDMTDDFKFKILKLRANA